jgi:hypothetical protein
MATRIDVTGAATQLEDMTLEALQKAVGGYLEFVPIRSKDRDVGGLYVDDDGIRKQLRINPAASILAEQPIYGPVVLLTKAEVAADMME